MNPTITFGMIVLNGQPFVTYNLRALYQYAHQIIVVEGACPAAATVSTPDGHSRDDTLTALRKFQAEEDPVHKVTIVTAEDEGHHNGFWTEKDEMSQAYAKRATGNYLWQIDADEFYRPEDMQSIIGLLAHDPEIKAVTFRVLTFWGGLECMVDSYYLQRGAQDFHRLFAWGPGYSYATHRPPTVIDDTGTDLRQIKWITADELAKKGIFMYHYEQLFPKQVKDKCSYYARVDWCKEFKQIETWAHECYLKIKHPYRVHMIYQHMSWLLLFNGSHNPQVLDMVSDVRRGAFPGIELRSTEDVKHLLASPSYRLGRGFLRLLIPINRALPEVRQRIIGAIKNSPLGPVITACRRKR